MITILDGGMGQELLARSKNPPSEMWSARVLLDEPELVTEVHRDYIRAGAEVITINAYAATPERLEAYGCPELFQPLQNAAMDCAKRARDAEGREVKIAGSLPPLYTSYNPNLNTDFERALAIYNQIADAQEAGVDILLGETLGSVMEATAALKAMQNRGKPIWLSLSLADDRDCELRSGEALVDGVAMADRGGVDALLLNCSMPETISRAISLIAHDTRKFGAYANGFSGVPKLEMGDIVKDVIKTRTDLDPQAYADFASVWARAGATLIGGCCEVGPAHIQELSKRFGAKP